MKKLFTMLAVMALSSAVVFAAPSNFGADLKKAVKQDIQNNIKANQKANQNAAATKKAEKIKEIDAKLADLNKEKTQIQKDKNITEVQRTLKLDKVQRQINFYTKQKAALK